MRKNTGYHIPKNMMINQGDVLLVNFGKSEKGLHGNHPAYVMSNKDETRGGYVFLIVPMFRSPSKDSNGKDVEISTKDCKGLKYEQFVQVTNITKIRRYQIIKKIGHCKNETVLSELVNAFCVKVGEENAGE